MTTTTGGMNHSINDSVTKAVVDNIMGNNPTRRPQVHCADCDLDFTSQTVLEAHLQGARHAKQIRSKTILRNLEETNVAFSKDQETNGLKCNVCLVYLNSIQQLHTHLNGNRHKKKMAKGDWMGKEIVSRSGFRETPTMQGSQGAPKVTFLSCPPCNKYFNSESQLNVHLASQKHSDKVNKNNYKSKSKLAFHNEKQRFPPYWKKGHNNQPYKMKLTHASQAPLRNNFVSGGYQTYA